jgi:transposase
LDSRLECKKKEGLANHKGQGGGHPKKLIESKQTDLKTYLQSSSEVFWTTAALQKLIMQRYGVDYSSSQVRRMMRSMKMFFYRPQPQDYRRSPQAEESLRQRILATFDSLSRMGYDLSKVAFGFADETAVQLYHNSCRFWAFSHQAKVVNTTKNKVSTFGFYALRGNDLVVELANSSEESFLKIIPQIRQANAQYQAVILLWDNLPAHKTAQVEQLARQNQLFIINNLPYAPDLNPIEKVWKQIKYKISKEIFIQNKQQLKNIIFETYQEITQKITCAKEWVEKILKPIDSQFCTIPFSKKF